VNNVQNVKFQVGSIVKLSTLSYYVVGRGNVLLTKNVNFENKHLGVFEFEATFAMAPVSTLVVYYVTGNGTIVSEQATLKIFAEVLPNPVSVID
jgi:Alpha-2-macroglobulin bait region domain